MADPTAADVHRHIDNLRRIQEERGYDKRWIFARLQARQEVIFWRVGHVGPVPEQLGGCRWGNFLKTPDVLAPLRSPAKPSNESAAILTEDRPKSSK